jgi:hypothetical protein
MASTCLPLVDLGADFEPNVSAIRRAVLHRVASSAWTGTLRGRGAAVCSLARRTLRRQRDHRLCRCTYRHFVPWSALGSIPQPRSSCTRRR